MPRRKDGEKTRDAILEGAAWLFSRKGFTNTTNADIARVCGNINTALISYYFCDKATLYRESWEFAYRDAIKKYPLDGNAPADAPPEERLRAIIHADILRRSERDSTLNGIIHAEISYPTEILTDVYEKSLASLRAVLRVVVAEMLGERATAEEQRLAVLSIFSMCIVPVEKIQTLEGMPQYTYDPEIRARHVYEFALGGLKAIKK